MEVRVEVRMDVLRRGFDIALDDPDANLARLCRACSPVLVRGYEERVVA